MKTKLVLITFCIAIVNTMQGQYSFRVSTGTYTELSNSISLNNGITWDDPQFEIPIGFDFLYYDTVLTTLHLDDWGLGGELTAGTNEMGSYALLVPYGADIIDRGFDFNLGQPGAGSQSDISYVLEGDPGSRILKIQWQNVGFYSELEADNVSSDFTNFQMWIYEGLNDIELHFGPNNISQPELSYDGLSGTYIALFPSYNFELDEADSEGLVLIGDPTNPTVIETRTAYDEGLNGIIPNGTIYRFSTSGVGINENNQIASALTLHPMPAQDYVIVSNASSATTIHRVRMHNVKGQQVLNTDYRGKELDISNLKAGVYTVTIETSAGVVHKRLAKQ